MKTVRILSSSLLLISVLTLIPITKAHAYSCTTSGNVRTCTFSATGSTETFTVPADITEISVVMYGGAGGNGGSDGKSAGTGGSSVGYISGTISVTPGLSITVAVGSGGTN
ncbi:MAG: hypothetical protein FGM59_04445, partial [Candidatus Nanopelagicaceae bacterium]|nr:hypothetical protein [Candidatus Nanopelagicaceae bacterium]